MGFLLAKFTIIFLLTAALSFILGHWWARRRFVDVTRSFEKLWANREPGQDMTGQLTQRLEALDAVLARAGESAGKATASGGKGKQGGKAAKAQTADSSADLHRLHARLGEIDQKLDKFGTSGKEAADVDGLLERMDSLEQSLTAVRESGAAPLDLSPLVARLEDMQSTVEKIVIPTSASEADSSDDLNLRLSGIEKRLERLAERLARQSGDNGMDDLVSAIEQVANRRKNQPAGAQLDALDAAELDHPAYGPPDDLMRIYSVGRRLAQLLNSLGVYYYWQIAEWSSEDAADMNERLGITRGRIRDEDWVGQARQLSEDPDAARKPR